MHLSLFWLYSTVSTAVWALHLDYGALPQAVSIALEPGFYDYFGGQEIIYKSADNDHNSKTIYRVLADDPKFSRITKALNFVEDVGMYLNDSQKHLTFFAPPDEVLHRPHLPHNDFMLSAQDSKWSDLDAFASDSSVDEDGYFLNLIDLPGALNLLDNLEAASYDDDDDDKKEKRKKILKNILRAILKYHIIPCSHDVNNLGQNTTYPTELRINEVFDGKPLRLRVARTFLPPVTTVNFYTRIVHPDIKASNGVIHVVNHPLIPPPSAFQELYMVPRFFSTFTSALQRSNLTHELDVRFVHGKGFEGAPLVTVFAPTNRAFNRLPLKLRLFLFSPFGEKVLRKLLEYHIVPEIAAFSNYVQDKEDYDPILPYIPDIDFGLDSKLEDESVMWTLGSFMGSIFGKRDHEFGKKRPHVEPIVLKNLTLDTLLENRTVSLVIEQNKIKVPFPAPKKSYFIETKVIVNNRPTVVHDIVGLNGAVHVIDKLLVPGCQCGYDDDDDHHHHHHGGQHKHHKKHQKHHKKKKHHRKDDEDPSKDPWNGWESWLLEWAEDGN